MEQLSHPHRGELPAAARKSASAVVGVWLLLALLVLLVLGVGWALGHRFSISVPRGGPQLPTLPGGTPKPQKP